MIMAAEQESSVCGTEVRMARHKQGAAVMRALDSKGKFRQGTRGLTVEKSQRIE